MEFVLIPAGEFLMGSNEYGGGRPHTVRISQPFYLGQYEVTQGQWQAIMGNNPSKFQGDPTLPVERVSWEDVQEFIRRLNAQEGSSKYRLPTEAEWEYAARAGTTTAYSFGDDPDRLGDYAWFRDNSDGKTHPVGQKAPNPWQLYDMHGNVWEWVQDLGAPYAAGAAVDPAGPSWNWGSLSRVYRGGSWWGTAMYCRSADRTYIVSGFGNGDGYIGYRLLRTVG
jgi:formylglycine-generating enzyme required for sulfatase activity